MKKIKIQYLLNEKGDQVIQEQVRMILKEHYLIEEPSDPDFQIVSGWHPELCFSRCVKLFIAQGTEIPDFNLMDYGIGVEKLSLGDRYLLYGGNLQELRDFLIHVFDQSPDCAGRCVSYGWNRIDRKTMMEKLTAIREMDDRP